jgi:L-alanine-DL-glutamate epimerase-like enolase superfamily enzyme
MRIAFHTTDSSKAIPLHLSRGRHTSPDDRGGLGILRRVAQVRERYGADRDVHVDAVGEWT